MKNILMTLAFTALLTVSTLAQTAAEKELLDFNAAYEKAQMARDAAFFETALADDYIFSGPGGETEDKAKAIAYIRSEKEKPTYEMISMKSDNVKARVIGNTGILTGNWTFVSKPAGDTKAEPHTDRGRYTSILEKRGGKWVVVTEHVSEAQHDRKLMEQEVLKASSAYTDVMRRRDKAGFERMLHETYTYTNERGDVRTKAEDIAMSTSGDMTMELMEASDQKVRIISNGSAVETGKFRVKGTHKGQAFDETGRYTTTWIWRGGRWQVAADHTSNFPAAK